jgi:hypothetical protein
MARRYRRQEAGIVGLISLICAPFILIGVLISILPELFALLGTFLAFIAALLQCFWQISQRRPRTLVAVGLCVSTALVVLILNAPPSPTAEQPVSNSIHGVAAAETPMPTPSDEEKAANWKRIEDMRAGKIVEATPTTTSPLIAVPTPESTPNPSEDDARQKSDKAEATPSPSAETMVRKALPVEDASAAADLNLAWAALTSRQRAALRQEERKWIKYNSSLPIETRNESTRERAKYLWSLVER